MTDTCVLRMNHAETGGGAQKSTLSCARLDLRTRSGTASQMGAKTAITSNYQSMKQESATAAACHFLRMTKS